MSAREITPPLSGRYIVVEEIAVIAAGLDAMFFFETDRPARGRRRSENPVLRTLAYLKHNNFVATGSKYGIDNYMMNVKYAVWRNFSNSFL